MPNRTGRPTMDLSPGERQSKVGSLRIMATLRLSDRHQRKCLSAGHPVRKITACSADDFEPAAPIKHDALTPRWTKIDSERLAEFALGMLTDSSKPSSRGFSVGGPGVRQIWPQYPDRYSLLGKGLPPQPMVLPRNEVARRL